MGNLWSTDTKDKNDAKNNTKNNKDEKTEEVNTFKRKALLFGLDFSDDMHGIFGCIADTRLMKLILRDEFGYDKEDIRCRDSRWHLPFKIQDELKWLFQDAQSGDHLMLYYSRFGYWLSTIEENIQPADYDLPLDYLYSQLESLPAGVKVTIIFDDVDGANKIDLPYRLDVDDVIDWSTTRERSISADVVMVSGCRTEKTLFDVYSGDYNAYFSKFMHEIAMIVDYSGLDNIDWYQLSEILASKGSSMYNVIPEFGFSSPELAQELVTF